MLGEQSHDPGRDERVGSRLDDVEERDRKLQVLSDKPRPISNPPTDRCEIDRSKNRCQIDALRQITRL